MKTREKEASIDVAADVEAQLQEEQGESQSSIDKGQVRNKETVLKTKAAAGAAYVPETDGERALYLATVALLGPAFAEVKTALDTKGRRINQIYSTEAKAIAIEGFDVFGEIRKAVSAVAGQTPIGLQLKKDVGVGRSVSPSNPNDVRDALADQTVALAAPTYVTFLQKRGVRAPVLHKRAKAAVDRLDTALQLIPVADQTAAERNGAINLALLRLDLILGRLEGQLRTHGQGAFADQLLAEVPRRRNRRAGDAPAVDDDEGGDGDGVADETAPAPDAEKKPA